MTNYLEWLGLTRQVCYGNPFYLKRVLQKPQWLDAYHLTGFTLSSVHPPPFPLFFKLFVPKPRQLWRSATPRCLKEIALSQFTYTTPANLQKYFQNL